MGGLPLRKVPEHVLLNVGCFPSFLKTARGTRATGLLPTPERQPEVDTRASWLTVRVEGGTARGKLRVWGRASPAHPFQWV